MFRVRSSTSCGGGAHSLQGAANEWKFFKYIFYKISAVITVLATAIDRKRSLRDREGRKVTKHGTGTAVSEIINN